jgi:hypothetical protein
LAPSAHFLGAAANFFGTAACQRSACASLQRKKVQQCHSCQEPFAPAAAKPVTVKGGIQVNYDAVARRMEATVKNALKPDRVAVIVYSGVHNVTVPLFV